jgi:hypothetical protein
MIVRYFGQDREAIVRKTVEILGPSCFESINSIERVVFENGSKLTQIGSSAFSGCELLTSIAIPPSVEVIGEFAFEECDGLEEYLIDEDGLLVKLGREAFADYCSLRSFYFPKNVREVGERCFIRCGTLHLLIFECDLLLKSIVSDDTLDEALERIGFAGTGISSLFKIEVNQKGLDLDVPGWVSIRDGDSSTVIIQPNK